MFGSQGSRGGSSFGGNRPVCKFFLEGRCRFGDSCKNEHPAGEGGSSRGRSGASNDTADSYSITTEQIKQELTTEKPIWPLSCYAPGRNPPRQLIDADFEHSPEEMRTLHYLALAGGNTQESAQREASLANRVETKVQAILNDLNGAMKYVVDGKDQHPNRIDMSREPFGSQSNTTTSTFGAPSAQPSTFGQPSPFGQAAKPSPFAQGDSAQGSAFGRPSNLGAGSAFGQPSALGGGSAFGKPSAMGQGPAFGQPSAMGQTSAFGKPSALGGGGSAFGQPSQPSGFGQPSSMGQTSAFGQASPPGQAPAFGQSGFAKPSPFGAAPASSQSTFGQASGLGGNKASPFAAAAGSGNASPFGGAASNANASPFAAAASNNTSPFASAAGGNTASPFAKAANSTSPFANTANNAAQGNTFGQPSTPSPFGSTGGNQQGSTFGQPSGFGAQPSPFAAAAPSAPPQSGFGASQAGAGQSPFGAAKPSPFGSATNGLSGASQGGQHLTRDGRGTLSSFKGRPVRFDAATKTYSYQNQAGKQERIWFPDGTPAPVKDAQASDDWYNGGPGELLQKLYMEVKQNGVFQDGVIPEIPPKADWVSFEI